MFKQQILISHIIKRFKNSRKRWSHELRTKSNTQKALQHFDDFYQSVYGGRWGGIRASLLTEHKYVALVNNFSDTESTRDLLERNGAINLRLIYEANVEKEAESGSENEAAGSEKDQTEPRETRFDKKLADFVKKQESTEVKAIYQRHAEEELENFKIIAENDSNRVINATEGASFKKSLEQTMQENIKVDLNRMVSPEVGILGLQEFIPATRLKGMEDYTPESDHYKYYNTTVDFPLNIEVETEFTFPENLDIYTYVKGDISRFLGPKYSKLNSFSHFLMDGASILPPLMLNVQLGDLVYDACSAPGGKSLILLQTLLPKSVVCNDASESRVNRIHKLFKQYLPDFDEKWNNQKCVIVRGDARSCKEFGKYDKILVDVPCTTDRISVIEEDNNIFKSDRVKERLHIPELQADILANCIKLLKPGGSLVYSTCSLSPVQNDGVVHMALSKAFADYHITATIKDLDRVMKPFRRIFQFENPRNLKYGQLILPYLPANFGPMYICKITRDDPKIRKIKLQSVQNKQNEKTVD